MVIPPLLVFLLSITMKSYHICNIITIRFINYITFRIKFSKINKYLTFYFTYNKIKFVKGSSKQR